MRPSHTGQSGSSSSTLKPLPTQETSKLSLPPEKIKHPKRASNRAKKHKTKKASTDIVPTHDWPASKISLLDRRLSYLNTFSTDSASQKETPAKVYINITYVRTNSSCVLKCVICTYVRLQTYLL